MKQTLYAWASIVVGCTILAAGFVFFINPYNIVPGGVYGASIVLHNLFPSIQVGTFGYMFDIPLLILSVLLLGAKLGIRTIVAALLTPLLMNTMSRLVYLPRSTGESGPGTTAGRQHEHDGPPDADVHHRGSGHRCGYGHRDTQSGYHGRK